MSPSTITVGKLSKVKPAKEPSLARQAKAAARGSKAKGVLEMASALQASEDDEKWRAKQFAKELEDNGSGKARHGLLPPGLTSTVTPGGIEANDPNAWPEEPRWQESPTGAIVGLDLLALDRHPDNREPTEADIMAKVQSFTEVGQLEPIVVWELDSGRYQILSGETRCLAAKRLGWATIQARIVTGITTAEALEYLARYNGERKDLNPIQKAKLVARLCDPKEQGGAGLTRGQAGERVGLESGGAVSNLVRLLELPKVWQDRVASGELPWTWAREMLPVLTLAPVMQALEDDWKSKDKNRDRWDENAFDSRAKLLLSIEHFVEQECRPLDVKHWNGRDRVVPKIDAADPIVRKQLGIVEVQLSDGKGKTKTVPVATNVEAFDKVLEGMRSKVTKASAEKAGRDEPTPKRELSAAELKQKAIERGKQRSERIAGWRHKLLRSEVVGCISNGLDNGFRLVMAYAAGPVMGLSFDDVLSAVTKTKAQHDSYRSYYWAAVAGSKNADDEEALTRAMAVRLLEHETSDWRRPALPHALVERYAEDLQVDVAAAWDSLQEMSGSKLAGGELLEEFFLLHQTEELRELAGELGSHLPPSVKTRAQICKLLLSIPQGTTRRLPLPKSIKPVVGVAKGKPAKKGKVKRG